ncbi:MAG: PDDEXK nuclease domain-containing protein [Polyangiaceae bacterium]
MSKPPVPDDYARWVTSLKAEIQAARTRSALAVNREMVRLYHRIGTEILERQQSLGWGGQVIKRLSSDLRATFPDMRGLSATNLKYMKTFAEVCPRIQIGQQLADQLPWFHVVTLLTKVADPTEREWYATQAAQNAWSRATLEANLRGRLHLRQGAALTNFERHLPAPAAELAAQALKDPYHFDFLGLGEEAHEHDIESALVRHITRFLLELGAGFAFVGRQYRIEVDGDEFFLDLLFYHTRLKCYVVVELKAGAFKPADAGQLNFYLAAVDGQIKAEDDKATIGLLLCKTKNRLVAEYALSGIAKPMGVAEYQLVRALPEPLDTKLPTIEQLEEELSAVLQGEDDA